MIDIKTENEIKSMAEGGKILASVVSQVLEAIEPGVSEKELDRLAEKLILEKGGDPGFKKVKGDKNAICVSTNDAVVHGLPIDFKIKEGGLVEQTSEVFYKSLHTDIA